ncbi:hypothetical protein [Rhodohalobacter sp.]|uniref:hypothetical protein n=1 Tax=Rhodohalobacter sp. TaxID=1974210 RepID=UPI002ACDCD7C|nr:hypothetical protein [Rhodohalobacter sp.]
MQSIWMIRLSLLSLLVAVILGGLILIHKAFPLHPAVWGALPLHYELAIWGWLVQFVMGTAYWMFPRHLTGPGRGSPGVATTMSVLYNIGLLLLLFSSATLTLGFVFALAGRGCLALAVLLFGGLMWRRVVSYKNRK